MPFEFEPLAIPEVILIKPKVFADERGFFLETYKKSDFERAGIPYEFIQDNHSASKKGVLRGLHYQKKPAVQGKLVRCVRGVIFDVAVDIRVGSPTFGKWVGVYLSEENKHMLWIPPGFAHGFLVVSDYAEVIYKVSHSEYSPAHDAGIIWNDPTIGIEWPLHLVDEIILSRKDENLPRLKELSEEDLL
jgi:dTDP-4-dehydrorhamnose 3,5-epimerase